MTITGGNGQTGTVGTTLPTQLSVHITDQNGSAIAGVHVSFNAGNGATDTPVLPTTDASGNASTTLTLGTTAGTDTVVAFADSIADPVGFTAVATPGAAATLVMASGNSQVATAGSLLINSLIVQVLDKYGNPVPGVTVDWTTTVGTLTAASGATSDANGYVSELLRLPTTPSVVTVTATVHGTSLTAVFTETAD